jgi:DNA-directed RNA polymerase specialized sigma24 family protein
VGGTESGDDETVFRNMYPALRRFAAVVAPPEEDPEDLVQEALVRTLHRRRLIELEDPERYLQTVILRVAANRKRSLGYGRRLLRRLRPPEGVDVVYPSEVSDLLRLSPDVRGILYLVEVEGWSYRDAATVAGCSVEAARGRA